MDLWQYEKHLDCGNRILRITFYQKKYYAKIP